MLTDYLKLALSSLLKRKLRSWLTMIGVFIGIAAVVSLIGLGEGLRNAIGAQFSFLGADKITIQASGTQFGPPGTGVVVPLDIDVTDKIERINGVEYAIPRLLETGKVEYNDVLSFPIVGSLPDDNEQRREIEGLLNIKPESGRGLKSGDRFVALMGNNYNDDDIFGKEVRVGKTILINDQSVEVVGIAAKTGTFFLDSAILMLEDPMRDLFDNDDDVNAILVKVQEDVDIYLVKENIEKLLRKERDVDEGEEDFEVQLAVDVIETIDSTLFAVQLFITIIAAISLIVGGIGILNTMYTAVVERTKEIGIMKSIGAKNSDIFFLFFVESGLLGMVGGIIGISLGFLIAKGLAAIGSAQLGSDLIQAHISLTLIIGSLAFSFILGSIAGITPALRASKLHPVDALRHSK